MYSCGLPAAWHSPDLSLETTTTTEPPESEESWVELGSSGCWSPSPERTQPLQLQLPLCGSASADEYLRLLREAQRESNQSSARVSPRSSPKSPPNSPNTELSSEDDLRGVYINIKDSDLGVERSVTSDWIWDWSSRPDQIPPKDWKFKHPQKKTFSIRQAKIGNNSLFSKEVLYTLFITNVMTLLLGTGVGLWLSRRGFFIPRVNLE
ncbi:BCL2/adenovirus E1B 19 kDa protein-interacting protein 3 isoform X1 [Frankliniella occidentalis]|uniref:BCL2/adenovirus E1B 19 kDa protein-interacting protein 3 isoform X1 n=1 Tax=Frankliniella occidentalis TaxID=133901 RepID=A0A6J1T1H2_FRAOC|nr:BCL2/adenovirus E1B 19 kDa protein-interacting protein 3 isoform X1 [Frankliniella occidentalis]